MPLQLLFPLTSYFIVGTIIGATIFFSINLPTMTPRPCLCLSVHHPQKKKLKELAAPTQYNFSKAQKAFPLTE